VCYLLNTKVAVALSYPYSLVTSEYMLAFEHTHTYCSLDDQITASKSCVPQYDNVGFAYIVAMFAHVTSSLTSRTMHSRTHLQAFSIASVLFLQPF